MTKLNETFTTENLPKSESNFEPLPPAWYSATLTSAGLKDTKAGTGKYIALRFDVTGPTHQGRVVFGNLNIFNPSAAAEKIGRQQLGELMAAAGIASLDDTDDLIGKQLQIKLVIQKTDRGDSNNIQSYKSLGGAMPSMTAPKDAPAASAKASPPWVKR